MREKMQKRIVNLVKTEPLTLWDMIILTLIMFGGAIYSSNIVFFSKIDQGIIEHAVEFSGTEYLKVVISELGLLCVVFSYLRFRRFDMKQWKVELNVKSVVAGLVLFLVLALGMDLFMAIPGFLRGENTIAGYGMGIWGYLTMISFTQVMAAVINGFFEELYFIGICLGVKKQYRLASFLLSLVVRFSFHTYQGLLPALGFPVVMGIIYYIVYTKSKNKNLFPFFLSHTVADILGLGILGYYL